MEIENILSDLIRIKTVNPPGGETEAARYLKTLFDGYGIQNEIIESSPGRGTFNAYVGEGKRSLLFLSHADVVAVSEGWSFPPFSGEIKDGRVHGRGAQDCKGLVAAEAWAVIRLAHEGRLKGRLIFAAMADEEAGGEMGAKYLLKNHLDKLKTDFCINEGGRPPLKIGGKTCHFIQTGEKGPVWIKLRTKGVSAHGSMPALGDNAVVKMSGVVKRLAGYKPKITLIPEVKQLVQKIAEMEGVDSEVTEDNVDRVIKKLKHKNFGGYLNAITRMTVSPNAIRGGMKTNIIPDACEADIDIRVLPGQDKEYILEELGSLLDEAEMEIGHYSPPTFSSSETDYYRIITGSLNEFINEDVVLPCISAGATDSRYLREAGIPCYGIDMMTLDLDSEMSRSVHGKNEKIDIASLRLKSDFLVRLAENYLGKA